MTEQERMRQQNATTPVATNEELDTNPDAITGAPGSHPVGTGIGAASGAATGVAVGAFGGPPGMIIGGISGAIVGSLIGHGIGEAVDPTAEEAYWSENYADRPYVAEGHGYETYQPYYEYGYTAASHREGQAFEDAEPELQADYEKHYVPAGGEEWSKARHPVKDAYDRAYVEKND